MKISLVNLSPLRTDEISTVCYTEVLVLLVQASETTFYLHCMSTKNLFFLKWKNGGEKMFAQKMELSKNMQI